MADRDELEKLLVDHLPAVGRILAAVGHRQGLRDDDLADFASWAMARLVADDYAVLARFRGESSLTTYLTVVLTMAAREYRVSRWGRWRPSAAARARGPLAIRLETLVYRDGLRLAEAAELLRSRGETTHSDRMLAALLNELPVREAARGRARDATVELAADVAAAEGTAADAVLRQEADAGRALLGRRLSAAIDRLPSEDRVLVRLRFWEGLSVADAARALGVPQKPLYRRLERAIAAMRAALLADGVSAAEVRALLDESLPAAQSVCEEPGARPSISAANYGERGA